MDDIFRNEFIGFLSVSPGKTPECTYLAWIKFHGGRGENLF
ncbi:hypothetical protein [Rothia nasimurium]|nr:hypothetical protein [Rothia nasimurium]